ncbi:MAG: hypothetical protein AAF648_00740 [Pseudomonadota bacterium]
MGDPDTLVLLAWCSACLALGTLVGAFWNDLRRAQRSDELTRSRLDRTELNNRSNHLGFGIADLQVRIASTRQQNALLRSEVKVRRTTYTDMNNELNQRWDEALTLKREQAQLDQKIEAQERAITEWKQRLLCLQDGIERRTEKLSLLQRELNDGLAVIDAELREADEQPLAPLGDSSTPRRLPQAADRRTPEPLRDAASSVAPGPQTTD